MLLLPYAGYKKVSSLFAGRLHRHTFSFFVDSTSLSAARVLLWFVGSYVGSDIHSTFQWKRIHSTKGYFADLQRHGTRIILIDKIQLVFLICLFSTCALRCSGCSTLFLVTRFPVGYSGMDLARVSYQCRDG